MVVIASLHHLSISLVWVYFCSPCPPRPRLEQTAFWNHSLNTPFWADGLCHPLYHLKFLSGSRNCKHSDCCLNICPFSCNSLFRKNEILSVESRVYLPAVGCAFVSRSEQPELSEPFHPFCFVTRPLSTIRLRTDQSECLFVSGQPIRKHPHPGVY